MNFFRLLTLVLLSGHFVSLAESQELSPNEASHLLAGSKEVSNPSPLFLKIIASKAWQDRLENSLKQRFSPPEGLSAKTRVTKDDREALTKFASENLKSAYDNTKTVFYPFGGPDAFYPFVFFPHTTHLIVAALEPPGSPLEIKSESDIPKLLRGMDALNRAFVSFFHYGYFITSEMTDDLNSTLGTSAVIAASLAAQGFTIVATKKTALTPDGNLVYESENTNDDSIKFNGTEITFRKNDVAQSEAKVSYFRQDLSNTGVNNGFDKFVQNHKIDSTYYKAASYVSHDTANFSKVNELALSSRFILQGDSGLPWSVLKNSPDIVNIDLYGHYTLPTKQFGTSYQKNLLKSIGAALNRSNASEEAFSDYKRITGSNAKYADTDSAEDFVSWKGYLPVRYDYAGMLNSHRAREDQKRQYSLLIFATLNNQ